jgi:hypothetical protein
VVRSRIAGWQTEVTVLNQTHLANVRTRSADASF